MGQHGPCSPPAVGSLTVASARAGNGQGGARMSWPRPTRSRTGRGSPGLEATVVAAQPAGAGGGGGEDDTGPPGAGPAGGVEVVAVMVVTEQHGVAWTGAGGGDVRAG